VRTTFVTTTTTTIDRKKLQYPRERFPVRRSRPWTKEHRDNEHQHRHSIYAAEATGLLLMAVLLLVLTIIRYWRYIPWSAR
jgi:hypothetical protein